MNNDRKNRHAAPERASGRMRLFTKSRVMAGAAALFGGAILLNALVFQTERHPAPLFQPVAKAPEAFPTPPQRPDKAVAVAPAPAAKPAPLEKNKVAALASGVPLPITPVASDVTEAQMAEIQRELSKRGFYKGEADGKPGPMTTQAIRDFQFAQRVSVDGKPSEALLQAVQSTKVSMREELLDLVKRANPDDKSDRTVLDVQRALNKVGYGPVTEDGQLGPSTKTALAKFEADKKLPPKGEPKGPVLRVLASTSGIPIGR